MAERLPSFSGLGAARGPSFGTARGPGIRGPVLASRPSFSAPRSEFSPRSLVNTRPATRPAFAKPSITNEAPAKGSLSKLFKETRPLTKSDIGAPDNGGRYVAKGVVTRFTKPEVVNGQAPPSGKPTLKEIFTKTAPYVISKDNATFGVDRRVPEGVIKNLVKPEAEAGKPAYRSADYGSLFTKTRPMELKDIGKNPNSRRENLFRSVKALELKAQKPPVGNRKLEQMLRQAKPLEAGNIGRIPVGRVVDLFESVRKLEPGKAKQKVLEIPALKPSEIQKAVGPEIPIALHRIERNLQEGKQLNPARVAEFRAAVRSAEKALMEKRTASTLPKIDTKPQPGPEAKPQVLKAVDPQAALQTRVQEEVKQARQRLETVQKEIRITSPQKLFEIRQAKLGVPDAASQRQTDPLKNLTPITLEQVLARIQEQPYRNPVTKTLLQTETEMLPQSQTLVRELQQTRTEILPQVVPQQEYAAEVRQAVRTYAQMRTAGIESEQAEEAISEALAQKLNLTHEQRIKIVLIIKKEVEILEEKKEEEVIEHKLVAEEDPAAQSYRAKLLSEAVQSSFAALDNGKKTVSGHEIATLMPSQQEAPPVVSEIVGGRWRVLKPDGSYTELISRLGRFGSFTYIEDAFKASFNELEATPPVRVREEIRTRAVSKEDIYRVFRDSLDILYQKIVNLTRGTT